MSPVTGLPAGAEELAEQLSWLGRKAVARGLVLGSGGNLSARLPGGRCLITSSGSMLDELDATEFSVLDVAHGTVVDGHPRPSSEAALHLHAYRARSDAAVLVHLHPQTSVLLDALGHEIRLITIDHAYYVRSVGRVPYLPSGSDELAAAAAAALADTNCVLLAHHGCSVVAPDVVTGWKRVANLEEAAEATYRALLLGDTTTVCPPAYLDRIRTAEKLTPGQH